MDPHGDDWRAELDRQRRESRHRYRKHLCLALSSLDASEVDPEDRADAILDALFVVPRREGLGECGCSCHPHLPSSDFHDYGFDCPCQRTAEECAAAWDAWRAESDAYWESPEGLVEEAKGQAEEDELSAWAEADPGVAVESHGGFAPEQWEGAVDGHSFYFRERHDLWRLELDLRPTGDFYRAMLVGEGENGVHEELREVERGDVIAEGTIDAAGYGRTPVERAQFLVGTIRAHLQRLSCPVHTSERDDLETLFGRPLRWCPDCGQEL